MGSSPRLYVEYVWKIWPASSLANTLSPGDSSIGLSTWRKLYSLPATGCSGVDETPKSKLKSLGADDTHWNDHPIRCRYASISGNGARDTATNAASRWARCTCVPLKLSAQNEQIGQPSIQPGPIMKWYAMSWLASSNRSSIETRPSGPSNS